MNTVATTASMHTAQGVAADLSALGLNATARITQASIPSVWVVEVTYDEPMTMNDYLARDGGQ